MYVYLYMYIYMCMYIYIFTCIYIYVWAGCPLHSRSVSARVARVSTFPVDGEIHAGKAKAQRDVPRLGVKLKTSRAANGGSGGIMRVYRRCIGQNDRPLFCVAQCWDIRLSWGWVKIQTQQTPNVGNFVIILPLTRLVGSKHGKLIKWLVFSEFRAMSTMNEEILVDLNESAGMY